ncbi:hypothetical protein A3F00_03305 [Candidatus Daviesbacteria bacterium RIFCSPHIGHO2_12_FULL_37_11]|uniref:Single-stranded DNA-binding protein n=1 Tax=Candidatus Daviesbacteria bacterium RIFCSPHIGHO2_12_FULL_37_11 TaxID=1797777 RepID=A0A1F5KB57_9BACT|nr:MAG: hypothetical protein A2769_03840 [Candidatus Daviesbacteria bacterium RIFCSPHIGHO2_01_FULL_37_27]OGE38044.1 MAG: hypothetical protein A3F00_03305 [Candidatus Daviesbacteria bacterium RIFCSPHIGHO2_12_FULL_37_11]OGE44761.1 MAG: hypothetical protein A3B39_05375 [Candidatus Daviesbacteria bacterium RIFCSPLOWO2_01_FULL_37_10]
MASRSWNRVELIGNLTRDPELRYTPNGAAVCTFGLATNRTYVSDGEKKEEVDFHRLVAWNKLAELCSQLLKKGNRAFISGRLQTRSWESADGQTRQTTEVVIEDMIILTPRSDSTGSYMGEEVPVREEVPAKVQEEAVAATNEVVEEKIDPDKIGVEAVKGSETPDAEESKKPEEASAIDETSKKGKPAEKPQENIDPDSDLPF